MLRVLGSLFAILFLGSLVAGGLGFYGYSVFTAEGPLVQNKIYMIDKGLGTPVIAARLAEQGIISNAHVFTGAAYLTGARGHLKAGEYEFPARATMQEVMALLTSGKSITYKLTVPEGWTSEMAVARINANDVLTGDPVEPPPEGSILPDTYVFHRGKTRAQVLADMQALQAKLVNELWMAHQPGIPLKSPEEAVTLASIVEKETAQPDERPLIASVFLNRLAKHMRLQSDPTIIYGIVGGKGRLDRKLTHTDVVTPTPYNTYTISGLPPGPIANPGRAALAAVMNPPDTTYLYFVADGSGGHAFASSLDEHNKNVAKWRDIAGNAAAAADADQTAPPAHPGTLTPADAAAGSAPGAGAAPQEQPGGGTQAATPPGSGMPAIESTGTADQTSEPAPANEQAAPIPLPETSLDATAVTPAAPSPAASAPAAPVPAETAPTPSPAQPAAPAAPVTTTTADATAGNSEQPAASLPEPPLLHLKPGSVIRSGDRLIPVPRQRPRH